MTTAANPIAALLGREADALERLLQALRREHEALKSRDVAAVERLAGEKQQLIDELEACAAQRAEMLRRAGLKGGAEGFQELLTRSGGGSALDAQWASVQERLRACQEQNQINGLLLDATQRQTQQLLSILFGQNSQPNTYDRQGAVRTSLGSRAHVKV